MENKKIIMYIIIILLMLFIVGIGILVLKSNKKLENNGIADYTPEQEITDEQMRQTNILLYFYDNNTGNLNTEIRRIDSKKLLNNPEEQLIKLLIEGPQDSNLTNLIPEETKLINLDINKGILYINFSEEFLEVKKLEKEMKNKIIESILKTVTQLNEIKGIKILINGEEYF